MRHLNYNHLFYFWTVAREGTITKASKVLHLTPQTISGQLKLLEEAVGEPLFIRVGKRLVLSEMGRLVQQYADEIYPLGAELTQRVRGQSPVNALTLNVGIVNSLAKLIAYRMISPALSMERPVRVACHEGDLELLLADLSIHQLDLVLSDRPIPPGLGVKAFNHILGDSAVSFFCHQSIVEKYSEDFPQSLDGAPMLLPLANNPLRRQLDGWFVEIGITPSVIAEFDDSALLKAFGGASQGIFPAPDVISSEIESMYDATRIGKVASLSETFYVISPDRKLGHPAASEICDMARFSLFDK